MENKKEVKEKLTDDPLENIRIKAIPIARIISRG